jgi:hypothetical protein
VRRVIDGRLFAAPKTKTKEMASPRAKLHKNIKPLLSVLNSTKDYYKYDTAINNLQHDKRRVGFIKEIGRGG